MRDSMDLFPFPFSLFDFPPTSVGMCYPEDLLGYGTEGKVVGAEIRFVLVQDGLVCDMKLLP